MQADAGVSGAVEGVTIYVSDFQRSFTDKLAAANFFTEPSQVLLASMEDFACE